MTNNDLLGNFIVCDSNAVKRNTTSKDGTWQLLNACPKIPAEHLLTLLKAGDVLNLNKLLGEVYISDKKKRGHPSVAERKENKKKKGQPSTAEEPWKDLPCHSQARLSKGLS